MAKFNPDVPEGAAPNYLSYSQTPEGNKSLGSLFKGIGDTFSAAITGTDAVIKASIDDSIYKAVDKERETTTGALEEIAGIPREDRVGDIQPGKNVLPSYTTQNIPGAVTSAEGDAETYTSAGKSNPRLRTYYSGRLDMIAKDIRAQYPGYREYIDRRIKETTGEDSANAVVRHLMEIINQNAGAGEKDLTWAKNFVGSRPGYPGAELMMQSLTSGRTQDPRTAVIKWATDIEQKEQRQKEEAADFKARQNGAEDVKMIAGRNISNVARDEVSTRFGQVLDASGWSGETMRQFVQDWRSGKLPVIPKDVDGRKLALALDNMLDETFRVSWDKANKGQKMYDGTYQSFIDAYGEQAAKDKINGQLEPYTRLSKALKDGDWGLATNTANNLKAAQADSRYSLFNDVNVGHTMQTADGLQHFGGTNMTQILIGDELSKNLIERFAKSQQYIDWQKSQMLDPNADPNKRYTLFDSIMDMQKRGVGIQNPNNPRPNIKSENEMYNNIMQFPGKVIVDPRAPDEYKRLAVRSAFSGRNDQILGVWDKNEDKAAAYTKLTRPDVVQGIAKLGPEELGIARNWADKSFNILFGATMGDVGKMPETPGVSIIYDSDNHLFKGVYKPQGSQSYYTGSASGGTNYTDYIDRTLATLNTGIRGMSNFIKASGGSDRDVDAYVLGKMTYYGLDPRKTVGYPGEMMKNIAAAAGSGGKTDKAE